MINKTFKMTEKLTVLIVDDDDSICSFVGEALNGEGYAHETASTAHDALLKIQNNHFDIALLDVMLPDDSGISILQASNLADTATQVIMMTAVSDINIVIQAMKLGALDYITKPFTVTQLIGCISDIVKDKKEINPVFFQDELPEDFRQYAEHEDESFKKINALALGVEAQMEYFDFHSRIVTERTVNLARSLGLSETDIELWELWRKEVIAQRLANLEGTMEKLKGNPLAQIMLGLNKSDLGMN